MTKLEFNNLSNDKKAEVVWEWGYYVTQKKEEDNNIVIFSLGNFLAQAKYTVPENKLECIKGVSTDEMNAEIFKKEKNNPFIQLVRTADVKKAMLEKIRNRNSISDNTF
jgi:hypothetical protein